MYLAVYINLPFFSLGNLSSILLKLSDLLAQPYPGVHEQIWLQDKSHKMPCTCRNDISSEDGNCEAQSEVNTLRVGVDYLEGEPQSPKILNISIED